MSPNSVSRKRPAGPRHWTQEEDDALRAAVEAHGPKRWKMIAKFVPSRSHTQCLQRWNKVLKPGLLKGPWTPEEDHLLRALVQQSLTTLTMKKNQKKLQSQASDLSSTSLMTSCDGSEAEEEEDDEKEKKSSSSSSSSKHVNWVLIAENIPGRSVKQCRERWCSNLDPRINKGSWTEEEDRILLETQARDGNCWASIARMLDGRTEHAVKTRFRSILRARRRQWSAEEDEALLVACEKHSCCWANVVKELNGARSKNSIISRYKQLTNPSQVKDNDIPKHEQQQQHYHQYPPKRSRPARASSIKAIQAISQYDEDDFDEIEEDENRLQMKESFIPSNSASRSDTQNEYFSTCSESLSSKVVPSPTYPAGPAFTSVLPQASLEIPQLQMFQNSEISLNNFGEGGGGDTSLGTGRLLRRLSSETQFSTMSISSLLAAPNNLVDNGNTRRSLLKRYSDSWGGELNENVKDTLMSLLDMEDVPHNSENQRIRSGSPLSPIQGMSHHNIGGNGVESSRLVKRTSCSSVSKSTLQRRGSSHLILQALESFGC